MPTGAKNTAMKRGQTLFACSWRPSKYATRAEALPNTTRESSKHYETIKSGGTGRYIATCISMVCINPQGDRRCEVGSMFVGFRAISKWNCHTSYVTIVFYLSLAHSKHLKLTRVPRESLEWSESDFDCLHGVTELMIAPMFPIVPYATGNPTVCRTIRNLLSLPQFRNLRRVEFKNVSSEVLSSYLKKLLARKDLQLVFDEDPCDAEASAMQEPLTLIRWIQELIGN